ncbi:HEAT repeat domain-containing protein [candidate division WOR-3 bacterium]|nr:HEAT repeat domain-containing protein [candidate division WOR-3 bacterium]
MNKKKKILFVSLASLILIILLLLAFAFGLSEGYKTATLKSLVEANINDLKELREREKISDGDITYGISIQLAELKTYLSENLESGDPISQRVSIALLGLMSSSRQKYIDIIISKLEEENEEIRKEAASALYFLKAPEAVDPLIKASENGSDYKYYCSFYQTLNQIGGEKAMCFLREKAKSGNPAQRKAATAIAKLDSLTK